MNLFRNYRQRSNNLQFGIKAKRIHRINHGKCKINPNDPGPYTKSDIPPTHKCYICGDKCTTIWGGHEDKEYYFCSDCARKYFEWKCKQCGNISYNTKSVPEDKLCWQCFCDKNSGIAREDHQLFHEITKRRKEHYHENFTRIIEGQKPKALNNPLKTETYQTPSRTSRLSKACQLMDEKQGVKKRKVVVDEIK